MAKMLMKKDVVTVYRNGSMGQYTRASGWTIKQRVGALSGMRKGTYMLVTLKQIRQMDTVFILM